MGRPIKTREEIEKELSDEFLHFMEPVLELKRKRLSGAELINSAFAFSSELWNALITDYYFKYTLPDPILQSFKREYDNQPEYLDVINATISRKKRIKDRRARLVTSFDISREGKISFNFEVALCEVIKPKT